MIFIKNLKKDEEMRLKAEKLLDKTDNLIIPHNDKELIEELQVYQVELEMQNEELRRTQLKLQKSENRYFELYNLAPTAYFTLDKNEQIKDVNRAGVALMGLEKNILIDKAFILFVAPDSRNKFYKHIKKVISTSESQKCDLNLLINLKVVSAHIETDSNYDANGNLKSILITASDISKLKKTEEGLLKSQKKLMIAMQLTKLAYWEYDVDSDMFTFDDQFYDLYGTNAETEGGYKMSSEAYANKFISPENSFTVANEIVKALETDDPNYLRRFDHKIIRGDGEERYISVLFGIIKDSKGRTIKTYGANQNVTERKMTEMELEKLLIESTSLKDELSTLIENIVDEVWFCDIKGNILLANAAARKFEKEANFESSKSLNGLIKSVKVYDVDGNLRPKKGSPLLRSLNGEIITELEEIVVFPSSKRKQYRQVSSSPIKNDKGEIISAVAVVRDITNLKEAEIELFKSEEFMKKIVENIPDMIFVKNAPKLDFLMVNKAGEALLGHSREELLGKTDYDFFPEKEAEFFKSKDNEVLENKKILDISEETVQTKNLGERILHTKKIPILNSKGEAQYLLGISEDITERRKAEIKVKKSEAFLRGIFDNMPSGMSVYQVQNDGSKGSDYIIKEFNRKSQQIEGMKREEVVGKSLQDIRPNIDEYGLISIFKKVYETGESIHYPAKIYTDENYANWYENYVFKTSTGEIVSIYNDVTEQKMAKEKIKKSLDEKEVLLREVHHRVKNNMQIISSLLNLQSGYVGGEAANILESSKMRVKSMAMVHEKLYNSSSLSRINLADYIQSLVSDLFYQYDQEGYIKNIIDVEDIEFNIETAIPIGLIINELLSNSLKYAFPNGRKGEIYISLKLIDNNYKLVIKDNGIGIPEDLDFENLDSLGLQLVNNLVDQLDGYMKIDKTHGTKFIITFSELEYKKRYEE